MLALLNALAILATGPTAPPPDRGPWMAIRPAEFVVVEIRADGGWRVLDRGPAQPADQNLARLVAGSMKGTASSLVGGLPVAPRQTVRFVLQPTLDGQGMLLGAANGYDQRLEYRALMRKTPGGKPEPTSVCPVLTTAPSTEVWPYLVDELDVGEFRLVEATSSVIDCR